MRSLDARAVAVGGILLAAVLTACLVIPATRQLGSAEGIGIAAAIVILPPAVLLTATGYSYYGLLRSLAVAVVVMILTAVVVGLIAVFVFAAALSATTGGLTLSLVLFVVPVLCVLALGLLALRLLPAAAADSPVDAAPD